MASKELKSCNVYFDPFLFVWAKILASEIYNESPDAKRMEVPESDFWYQGIAPITIEFENRGDILIWSNKAMKRQESEAKELKEVTRDVIIVRPKLYSKIKEGMNESNSDNP